MGLGLGVDQTKGVFDLSLSKGFFSAALDSSGRAQLKASTALSPHKSGVYALVESGNIVENTLSLPAALDRFVNDSLYNELNPTAVENQEKSLHSHQISNAAPSNEIGSSRPSLAEVMGQSHSTWNEDGTKTYTYDDPISGERVSTRAIVDPVTGQVTPIYSTVPLQGAVNPLLAGNTYPAGAVSSSWQ